jgi:hypothetical protein
MVYCQLICRLLLLLLLLFSFFCCNLLIGGRGVAAAVCAGPAFVVWGDRDFVNVQDVAAVHRTCTCRVSKSRSRHAASIRHGPLWPFLRVLLPFLPLLLLHGISRHV